MPTWVLLVIVCVLPVLVSLIGGYLGWDPHLTVTVVWVVNAGPVAVLAGRTVAAWGGMSPAPLAPSTEWTIAVTPAIIAALVLAWAYGRSARHERASRNPVAWCARCDTTLYADHAGRYYSTTDGYLCPQSCVSRAHAAISREPQRRDAKRLLVTRRHVTWLAQRHRYRRGDGVDLAAIAFVRTGR
jgi:hypothetical protein